MWELVTFPISYLSPEIPKQKKKRGKVTKNIYLSAHTQRFFLWYVKTENRLSFPASTNTNCMLACTCVRVRIHTHTPWTRHPSGYHRWKKGFFPYIFRHKQIYTHTDSKNPASLVLWQGSPWGPRRGKCLGNRRSLFSRLPFLSVPVKWTLASLALAFPVGFIWSAGWGIVVCTIPRSAC